MTYTFKTDFGGGVILAPCLATLCAEVAASPKYRGLTNLGEIGDTSHQAQGTSSDHNPFVVHNGRRYVRAVDFGGDKALLLQLRSALFTIYRKHDPRIYPYGYCKGPDSLIFDWPPGTGYHVDSGDEGHLHVSVGIKDPNDPNGWIPALDSTAPWGIDGNEDDVSAEDVWNHPIKSKSGASMSAEDRLLDIETDVSALQKLVAAIAAKLGVEPPK